MNFPLPNPWLDALPQRRTIPNPRTAEHGALLLHLGEAWYPPAPTVYAQLPTILADLQRYPDSSSQELREAISLYCGHGITPENIIIGNGSDGLIDLLAGGFASRDRAIVAPIPTFFAYGNAAISRQISLVTSGRCDRQGGYALDVDDLLAKLPPAPGIIFLANPNNPTGETISVEIIARIAASTSALVVIDECYFEFSQVTALPLLRGFANVVILRSLSKSFALAGLRIGYAIADHSVIETLMRIDQTFSVNVVGQRCANIALQFLDYYRVRFAETISLRAEWQASLSDLGLRVFPSKANIMLVDYGEVASFNVAQALRSRSIYVADFHSHNGVQFAFRVAVADRDSLRWFSTALAETLLYEPR